MPDDKNKLFLYEALELRAELDAHVKTLKECLPEARKNRDRHSLFRDNEFKLLPSKDFDIAKVRKKLRSLEDKRRKLNTAIQKANLSNQVDFQDQALDLSEALELRKGLNEQLGELHSQVVDSAFQRVIYKEDRDIVEPADVSFTAALKELEDARRAFRELNRKIRAASFSINVDFKDEQ